MRNTFSKTVGTAALAILMMTVTEQIRISAQDTAETVNGAEQTSNDVERIRSLEGVWSLTTTPRNCDTGVPNPTAAFEALLTFHKGGTLSAWVQGSTIIVTRSPGHGLWQRERGWGDYSFKFIHLRYDLTTGAFRGKQESGGTLQLSARGDAFTTDSQTEVFDLNGNVTGGGCANAVGTRFTMGR